MEKLFSHPGIPKKWKKLFSTAIKNISTRINEIFIEKFAST